MPVRAGLDRIDLRLLELLQADGRQPYAELGAAVGISGYWSDVSQQLCDSGNAQAPE